MKYILVISLYIILNVTLSFAQWMQTPASPNGYLHNITSKDGVLYLSHFSNGIYRSDDGGSSWQQINNGLNNNQSKSVTEIFVTGDTLFAATVDGIYKSTNSANDWIKKSSGITIGPGALAEFCESIFEYNGVLFTGAWNGIYRSTDNAETWTITNVTGQGISAKNFTNHNGILFAARENINFPNGYFSTDNGQTWNPLTTLNFPTITFFSEGTKLWAGTIHGAWLSTDDGMNWESRSVGLNPDPYSSSIIRVNGDLITSLKFGGSGIFKSSDEGLSWEDFGEGLPFLSSVEKLIVYDDKIFASTSDGLWQRDTLEVITSSEEKNYLPQKFELYQNYPNPFNPTTKIKFSIPTNVKGEMSNVSLKVYDALGNEVATLVDEYKQAGIYEVEFHADELVSGIYFYKLEAGAFIETKKMILLK